MKHHQPVGCPHKEILPGEMEILVPLSSNTAIQECHAKPIADMFLISILTGEEDVSVEEDEEVLTLLYDPCLNCYFDPQTGKYYELV